MVVELGFLGRDISETAPGSWLCSHRHQPPLRGGHALLLLFPNCKDPREQERTKALEHKRLREAREEGTLLFSWRASGGRNHGALDSPRCHPLFIISLPVAPAGAFLLTSSLAPRSKTSIEQSGPVRNPEPRNKMTVALVHLHVCSGS